MSDLAHKPEFSDTATREAAERKRMQAANETARTYARVFSSDDGKAVLDDLRKKFGHDRPRFDLRDLRNALPQAALIDGQCSVLREIETAIKAGLS